MAKPISHSADPAPLALLWVLGPGMELLLLLICLSALSQSRMRSRVKSLGTNKAPPNGSLVVVGSVLHLKSLLEKAWSEVALTQPSQSRRARGAEEEEPAPRSGLG